MAYTIYDGFNVNFTAPIDYRMTAANAAVRTAITWKYDGMKVFQLDNRLTYVWNSGTSTWSIDTIVGGTGSLNYIPKVTATSPYVTYGNSPIYASGSAVGINTNNPRGSYTYLQIGGANLSEDPNWFSLQSQPIVIHKGGNSVIGYNWYYNSGDQYFNSSQGSSLISFATNSDITIANRQPGAGTLVERLKIWGTTVSITSTLQFTNLLNTRIHSDGSTLHFYVYNNDALQLTDDGYVYINGGNGIYLSSNGDGTFIDSYSGTNVNIQRMSGGNTYFGGQVRLANGTLTSPALSFSASTNTGIYATSNGQMAFAVFGSQMMRITDKDLYANIHSTGGGTANHLNPSISSGTYSPVVSGLVNCAVTHTDNAYWLRVGNVVTVSGRVSVDPTSASTNTQFRLTIPISYSNMFGIDTFSPFGGSWSDETWRLNGVGQTKNTILSGDTCAIEATSVSNTPYALFSFYATQTISRFIHYTYQYVLGGGPYVIPGGGGGGGS